MDTIAPVKPVSHTPGTWTAKGSEVFVGRNCIGIFDTDNDTLARYEANARLAAAAPDMLAALKMVKHGAEYVDEIGDVLDAAIAKAEGR